MITFWISFLLICLAGSCGIEVGNPANQDSPNNGTGTSKLSEDIEVINLVASDQYNETLRAATDVFDTRNLSTALNLQGLEFERVFTCIEEENVTTVNKNTTGTLQYERGFADRKRAIDETLDREASISYSSDTVILCDNTSQRARIPWNSIQQMSISMNQNTNRARKTTSVVDGSLILNRQYNLIGNRTITIARLSNRVIQETMSYENSLVANFETQNRATGYSHTMKTSANSPLVMNKLFGPGESTDQLQYSKWRG